jgi:hypothetical protein
MTMGFHHARVHNHNKQRSSTTMQVLRRSCSVKISSLQSKLLPRSSYRFLSYSLISSTRPASSKTVAASRLTQVQRQLLKTVASRKEYNMASEDPKAHNNADFQLSEVFNVRDKVVLITGKQKLPSKGSIGCDANKNF